MSEYVRRTLLYRNDKGETERASDQIILTSGRPIVVLGEPGMGKTFLLGQLASEIGCTLRSAASFVVDPDPVRLVPNGAPLIIDGLDELAAASESDPVNRVLGQLIKAGCPPFILSCRAADWRGAVAREDLSSGYGIPPIEMTLEPFSREAAVDFLASSLGRDRADEIVAHLEDQGIPDLYGNPLTLRLFAEVAAKDFGLPSSRAELILRATKIMWSELGERHDSAPLSNLDEATALDAAGAVFAAYILTGSEVVSAKRTGLDTPQTLPVAEISSLPGGSEARTLLKSRLFSALPGTPHLFKPVHRSIAEFLGARWLSRSAADDLARERLLAIMTLDDGVPASLRGIHAWLTQDERLAPAVIATDPYGVLRYGDADGLTVELGSQLLKALKALDEENPYFRSEDWQRHSAKGLTHLELLDQCREILVARSTGSHLRTLLLGFIRGSQLATALADDLYQIMLQSGEQPYTYAERHDAAQAIAALEEQGTNWPELVERLIRMGDEDSTRLAVEMMDEVGFDHFPADLIARAVLSHIGLVDNHKDKAARYSLGGLASLFQVARHLTDDLLAPVLDELATQCPVIDHTINYRTESELSGLTNQLIARQLKIAIPEPLRLLSWLRIIPTRRNLADEEKKQIAAFFEKDDELRRALQQQVIFVEHGEREPRPTVWDLQRFNEGLSPTKDDVISLLHVLPTSPMPSDEKVEIWRQLVAVTRGQEGVPKDVVAAARLFVDGRADLEARLSEMAAPWPEPDWRIREELRQKEADEERAKEWARQRQNFGANEAALRVGELRWVHSVALCYLGLFNDITRDLSPPDRIVEWLGGEMRSAALDGLEATLHRDDLPTAQQVAASYAQSSRWNFIYPMIAGVVERIRLGRGFDDLTADTIIAVRIALHNEHLGDRIDEQVVYRQLDKFLRRDQAMYEQYIRLLIEPSLERQLTNVSGLYSFVRTSTDIELAQSLSAEWLERYPDLPADVELELIDVLVSDGDYVTLRRIRRRLIELDRADSERRRNWQSVGLLVDFEATVAELDTVKESERDFLWNLRHCLVGDSRSDRPAPALKAEALAWVVRQFRSLWPCTGLPAGVVSGDTNPWDATEFLQRCINRLASDPSDKATHMLVGLIDDVEDGYTPLIRYAAYQQRHVRREATFPGITLNRLKDVIAARPPATSDDLLVVVRYTLKRLQKELHGNDTDSVGKYWGDNGQPRDEDRCTDALVEDLQRLLPFKIDRSLQADMPKSKIADILYMIGDAALPVECKGQWNAKLWSASVKQLDKLYLRDWRSQNRGLYIVYWFGRNVASNFRLKSPPGGGKPPLTVDELRDRLIDHVPPERRSSIAIEVLDLTR